MGIQNIHSTYIWVVQTPWGIWLVSSSHITDDVDAKAAGCFSIICSQLKALWPWFHLTEEVGEERIKKCSFWSEWISMLPVTLMPNNTCFRFTVLCSCEIGFPRFGSMWGSVVCGIVWFSVFVRNRRSRKNGRNYCIHCGVKNKVLCICLKVFCGYKWHILHYT